MRILPLGLQAGGGSSASSASQPYGPCQILDPDVKPVKGANRREGGFALPRREPQ